MSFVALSTLKLIFCLQNAIILTMEPENTASINALYELATTLNDHATKSHLQWFIDEQVEEEKSMEDIIAMLDRVKNDATGLLFLNDKLAARNSADIKL